MDYLMRSLMFVPGHREDLLLKAATSNADILLLDVEDSVQPRSNKKNARETITRLIADGVFCNRKIFIRVNDRESGELLNDLDCFVRTDIAGFVYPKSKGAEDIFFIDRLIESYEFKFGLRSGKIKIIPLIETTEAVLNVLHISKSSPRLVAIAYGCEDFLTDLQGNHNLSEMALHVPRAMIAMAARATGIIPIDTVHVNVHDTADLETNLNISKTLGFEGMLVLNPKEIPYVHECFSPTESEVENAKYITEQSEIAVSGGNGVAIVQGRFIGPPLLAAAQKILKKNELITKEKK